MLGWFEDAVQEDILPRKGKEESGVALFDLTSRFGHVVRGGEARGDVGIGRAVGREGVELRAASRLDLGEAPVRGACRAQGHDEGDGGPQAVDRGAADLGVRAEGQQEGWPLALHGAEMSLPGDLLVEGGRTRRGEAPGAGQGASALEGVDVLALPAPP
jgi:hypothetical protein